MEHTLEIAKEIVELLAYLHSASSLSISNKDINSTNILADEKYVTKVSYFGTSRSIVVHHTHLTTLVEGKFAYFDPEYFSQVNLQVILILLVLSCSS